MYKKKMNLKEYLKPTIKIFQIQNHLMSSISTTLLPNGKDSETTVSTDNPEQEDPTVAPAAKINTWEDDDSCGDY